MQCEVVVVRMAAGLDMVMMGRIDRLSMHEYEKYKKESTKTIVVIASNCQ